MTEVEALVGQEAGQRANKGQNEWRTAGTTAAAANPKHSNLAPAVSKRSATAGGIASPVKGVIQKEDGR